MKEARAIRFVENGALTLLKSDAAVANPLLWTANPAANATFSANAPCSKVLVGFPDAPVQLGDLQVTMEQTERRFLALTLNARDGKAVGASSSLLLTVAGNVENTGMKWNAERTSVGEGWGRGPTLAEGIPADIALRTAA